MPTRPTDLARQLERGLAPVYLVSGDETLLVQECCDDILRAARARGFSEREIVDVDRRYQWAGLREQTASLSLFAERRIFDLRVPPKQLDRQASDALRAYLEHPADDTLLLLRTERLDPGQRRSAWFKAIERKGVAVLVWPVSVAELPRWLDARCRKAGLRLEREALAFLSARVEGNLLAAVQEVEKLRILDPPQPLTLQTVQAAVVDASHYDSFDAIDAALAQQMRRVRHVVSVLRQEGVQPLALLGALTMQLKRLQSGVAGGMPPQRVRAFEAARRRLDERRIERMLSLATVADQQVKGMCEGDAWRTLEDMLLLLAGQQPVAWLHAHDARLRRFV